MVDRKIINRAVVLFLIGAVFVMAFFLLKPLIMSIFLGVFVAYMVHPLYLPIKKLIKGKNLSTLVFSLAIIVLILVPVLFFLPLFVREIFESYLYIQKIDLTNTLARIIGSFFNSEITNMVAVQINLFVTKFFDFSLSSFSNSFADLPNIMLKFAVFVFTFYFTTRDSEKINNYFSDLSPISKNTEKKFSQEFRNITNSVVFGQVLVGVIQGICLGLGMWLLGVPKSGFLTVVAIIVSIIPIIGAWLVWVPVSLYLFVSGNTIGSIVLFFYGLLFVSTIDNILRPYFISKRSNVGTFIAILGIIGGIYTFGIMGLIIGPLVLSYLLIIIEFYRNGKLNELFDE